MILEELFLVEAHLVDCCHRYLVDPIPQFLLEDIRQLLRRYFGWHFVHP
jgi:hypothetical protein